MPSKPKKQIKFGIGTTVEEAFASAVPAKSQGTGLKEPLERPARTTATKVAEAYEESTNGGWRPIPTAYVESRDFKKEQGLSGKRGTVWLFVKSAA